MLINTHHHGDHTYGNSLFGAATIIAQEKCREEVIAFGTPGNIGIWEPVDWGNVTLAPPTLAFANRVRLWSGDHPVEVSYVGQAAHTSNDSLVWLPEQEVLFCGDLLFNGGTPFLLMGSVRGAIDVLTNVVAPVPARVIVPGARRTVRPQADRHGLGYLRIRRWPPRREGDRQGLSPLELARGRPANEYDGWLDSERIVGNLHRPRGPRRGREASTYTAALTNMVAFNGGQPLSCYA